MKKTLTIIVAIIILAIIAVWYFAYRTPEVQDNVSEILEEDTTSEIQEDLNSLDLGDLDAEFEAIDAELEQL